MTLLFAVIITILVLAAQYESWTDPVAVVATTLPAVLGAILGCIFLSQSVSIYTQIGIILLLGMAAKNAILIVEYAMDYRKAGGEHTRCCVVGRQCATAPYPHDGLGLCFGVMPMLLPPEPVRQVAYRSARQLYSVWLSTPCSEHSSFPRYGNSCSDSAKNTFPKYSNNKVPVAYRDKLRSDDANTLINNNLPNRPLVGRGMPRPGDKNICS